MQLESIMGSLLKRETYEICNIGEFKANMNNFLIKNNYSTLSDTHVRHSFLLSRGK